MLKFIAIHNILILLVIVRVCGLGHAKVVKIFTK